MKVKVLGSRCSWCVTMELRIASQATRILSLMDDVDALQARNNQLVADNRRLRLALGHPRPLLAEAATEEEA